MRTVAEIKSAIERLSVGEVSQLAEWLQEYHATIFATRQVFGLLDSEEGPQEQWRQQGINRQKIDESNAGRLKYSYEQK